MAHARAAAFMGYKLICDWEGLTVARDPESRIPRFTDPNWRGYLSEVSPSLFRSKYEQRLPEVMLGAAFLQAGQFHPDPFTAVRPEIRYRVRSCTRYAWQTLRAQDDQRNHANDRHLGKT